MIFFRISNHADLAGMGGELYSARWHTAAPGRRIVYLSDHPALCLLEKLVHIDRALDLPSTYHLLAVEIPDAAMEEVAPDRLPPDWRHHVYRTQALGDAWLESRASLGWLVPSVLVPQARNCLFNPLAPRAASVRTQSLGYHPLDERLL